VFAGNVWAISAMDSIIAEGYSEIAHLAGYKNVSIGRNQKESYQDAMKKMD
jgi:hypothetical protein